MKSILNVLILGVAVALARAEAPAERAVTTGTLLEEMKDLAALARFPDPSYRNVQFSSYDRRSTTPEAPGWFSNADGFGGEAMPGFAKTLRNPEKGKPGLYVVADVRGPGAIVRGWSAGMEGVLRVYLNSKECNENPLGGQLIYEGPAYEFLARRSVHFLKTTGVELEAKDAFIQQDADYLPIPFADGLTVTWEGRLNDLHFYHLQVRKYPIETTVRTFDPKKDLKEFEPQLRAAVTGLTTPTSGEESTVNPATPIAAKIAPGSFFRNTIKMADPSAITELKLKIRAKKQDEALRGCLLRIAFDGSQRPQVDAPLGDFFASGPGINPFSSLPITVAADGTMTCRFVMPFRKTAQLEIVNHTAMPVELEGQIRVSSWKCDDDSMFFHAKWRIDPDLMAGPGSVIDLPYSVAIGKGVFVGCACMIMNPTGVPTASGNWWGEGDEKFLVDGEKTPSIFGTGSEDYFNYSWSRPALFGHPYCGQPLDSGPDTAGFVSNHRFQVLDAVPFEKSLAAFLELWAHTPTPGLSYARITYYYARPDAIDDHRSLVPADLKIQPLPRRQFQALRAAKGGICFHFDDLKPEVTGGKLEIVPLPIATRLHVAQWHAEKGGKLKFSLPIEKEGRVALHLIAVHRPEGAVVRVLLDGKPLAVNRDRTEIALRSTYAPRILNVNFQSVEVKAGSRAIEIECVEAGAVGLDSIWMRGE